MKTVNWFEVDKKGLQALQAGKNKTFIIRELVQNAFDEDIKGCYVSIDWMVDYVGITVIDDSPEGFRNLAHAYTLYADTYKRKDPKKRGRFNLGEKEVLSICEYAEIRTTKGTIIFDKEGRRKSNKKRAKGSEVYLTVKMKKSEMIKLISYAKCILPPAGVIYRVNDEVIEYKEPYRITVQALKTYILIDNDVFAPTKRLTEINIHKEKILGDHYLLEMGIPVCKIDCDYSLDVQQKVPLSTDRTKVNGAYLKDLYAAVLNITFDEVTEETSSNHWIRSATTSDNIKQVAVEKVIAKRYGDKVVVANPMDPNSIDRAISNGYRVIRGGEMSSDEWQKVRKFEAVESSTNKFGSLTTDEYEYVKPDHNQLRVEDLIHRVANRFMSTAVKVVYIRSKSVTLLADYATRTHTVRFNLSRIPADYWKIENDMVSKDLFKLILHELCHEYGMHYEEKYHRALTRIGIELVYLMKKEPKFFTI